MFKSVDPKITPDEREKKIVKFWKKHKSFEKSIENRREAPIYSFFDGPPFITNLPHYGNLLSSISKDVVPRYWTMRGYRVDRRWGWDCHGLPAENMVEKRLGIKSKKEIEEKVGIEKFIKECFRVTNQIAGEWEAYIDRIGRWVDYKNAYKTMDPDYMESVWWGFKELWNKGLVYQDTRISLYCPRCATPLANFEIAMDNSYEEVEDTSIYVRFSLEDSAKEQLGVPRESDAYFIAWTTTPWTLLANTALAVNPELDYVVFAGKSAKNSPFFYILSQNALERLKKPLDIKGRVIKKIKGSDLLGLRFVKLINDKVAGTIAKAKNSAHHVVNQPLGWRIVPGTYVTEGEGSGIVQLAPAFGEDDYNTAKAENLPVILNVDEEGKYLVGKFKGRNVWEANPDVIKYLNQEGLLVGQEKTVHSYPFCHRCHTKLIYKIQPAWFVKISAVRDKLIAANEDINWHPSHLKHGRFLKGIETAPDWNISRDRYFGTAIPIWRCEACQKEVVIGSYDELYQYSGHRLEDYHRPAVDNITFKCPDCENICHRVPQVFDSWIDSGSMPFAERHYPFKNQEDFNQKFPADFVSEYIAQTRAWYYVMHVIAVSLFDKPAFKNVITTGTIMGSDGKKMSKSLGNFPDPKLIIEKYSADALRFYLMSSPIMEAQNIDFTEEKMAEIQKGMLRAWWNSYYFFVTYARLDKWQPDLEAPFRYSNPRSFKEVWQKPQAVIDSWILSELHTLIRETNKLMDGYFIAKAARLLPPFIDKLSNWYIRRSRKRFWKSENDADKNEAYQTLYEVLSKLSRIAAPFLPFLTEEIYQNLNVVETGGREPGHESLNQESVHHTNFPGPNAILIDEELNTAMERIRQIVTLGLSCRAKAGIKVRQPLRVLFVGNKEGVSEDLWNLVKEEVNVKEVRERSDLKELVEKNKLGRKLVGISLGDEAVALDFVIDAELALEGEMRELVRQIQEERKKAGFNIEDRIFLGYMGKEELFTRFGFQISAEVLAEKIFNEKLTPQEAAFEVQLGREKVLITLRRVGK
jgi:isoleucyl-tRNA synthetase